MVWVDELAGRVEGPQIVNDSKTPSGPVHVGSLRGVLIHDAVYRALRERGIPARYLFGVDDYDPLDELPPNESDQEQFRKYLGMPLCNVPAPEGSAAGDLAEHYVTEFFEVFKELGVAAETYRMRDIYRSGEFDQEIDLILSKSDVVRRIDREVANARRDDDWFPFQVVCERCGRVGTTKVYAYDGTLVSYHCLPNLVKWAEGCGYSGRISPFSGNGKLSWKLEWTAKWSHFPVTIEGAGKDHNTKGGSRDVAVRCLREVFKKEPPLNIPYEFFLVRGAKMSSSRGVGVSAREMANLLPPELLRFLMIRNQPNRPVDFSPEQERIVLLYSEFDRTRARSQEPDKYPTDARLYSLAGVAPEPDYYAPPFDLLLSLIQMPHLDLTAQVERMKGSSLTELDVRHLDQRVASARYWLARFASDDERFELKQELPPQAASLTPSQRTFLRQLANALADTRWEAAEIQACIFDTARLTPINHSLAFEAIYCALSARKSGPRAGNLLSFLDGDFVRSRFLQVAEPSLLELWSDSSESTLQLAAWLQKVRSDIVEVSGESFFAGDETEPLPGAERQVRGRGILELLVLLKDGKRHLRRCSISAFEGFGSSLESENEHFQSFLDECMTELASIVGHEIPVRPRNEMDSDQRATLRSQP